MTTAYHPQTNDQAERFNGKIVTSFRHYVSDLQQDCLLFIHSLTYGYNAKVRRTINTSLYSLVLSWRPLKAHRSWVPRLTRRQEWQIIIRRYQCKNFFEKHFSPYALKKRQFEKISIEIQAWQQSIHYHNSFFYSKIVCRMSYVDDPALQTVPDASAEAMTRHTYNKLQDRTSEPYLIVSVQNNLITTDDNGNPPTVSIDLVQCALSPTPRQPYQPHNGAKQ